MITDEQKKELEAEIKKYIQKRGSIVEVLKIFQRDRGWISDDTIKEAAPLLDMSADELESVASLYNLIFEKPIGRHLILVCDSVSCWIVGYEKIVSHIKEKLGITFGQTTVDGRFTLLPAACLGACEQAPAIMVDDKLFGNVDITKLDSILEEFK